MTAAATLVPLPPLRRSGWWLLFAIHVPSIAFVVAQGWLGLAFPAPARRDAIGLVLAVMACAIQLRHSVAAAQGIRPRYWMWTLLVLMLVSIVPLPWFRDQIITMQWFVFASFAMLLPTRVALITSIVSSIMIGVWYASISEPAGAPMGQMVWAFCYWEALLFLGGAGLYGATRLVRLMDQLRDARADLAELAIGRERLRISRDLHDLLGQSLSAVSLKGDLAIGLLARNELPRAVGEIESLVTVARSALHDLRDIAHREPPIALSSEIERAVDLLASTGTETRVDIEADALPPAVDELFAWALREGVTNVLRHSAATTCAITIGRHDGTVRLEIVNDGAMPTSASGSGLSGLAARAAALSGAATARSLADGRFRLRVDVPEVAS
jgi:two-component system, NarL family, sensor histidine kinase DesK